MRKKRITKTATEKAVPVVKSKKTFYTFYKNDKKVVIEASSISEALNLLNKQNV